MKSKQNLFFILGILIFVSLGSAALLFYALGETNEGISDPQEEPQESSKESIPKVAVLPKNESAPLPPLEHAPLHKKELPPVQEDASLEKKNSQKPPEPIESKKKEKKKKKKQISKDFFKDDNGWVLDKKNKKTKVYTKGHLNSKNEVEIIKKEKIFFENGLIQEVKHYKNKKLHGPYKKYHQSEDEVEYYLSISGTYDQGLKDEEWIYFYHHSIIHRSLWHKGSGLDYVFDQVLPIYFCQYLEGKKEGLELFIYNELAYWDFYSKGEGQWKEKITLEEEVPYSIREQNRLVLDKINSKTSYLTAWTNTPAIIQTFVDPSKNLSKPIQNPLISDYTFKEFNEGGALTLSFHGKELYKYEFNNNKNEKTIIYLNPFRNLRNLINPYPKDTNPPDSHYSYNILAYNHLVRDSGVHYKFSDRYNLVGIDFIVRNRPIGLELLINKNQVTTWNFRDKRGQLLKSGKGFSYKKKYLEQHLNFMEKLSKRVDFPYIRPEYSIFFDPKTLVKVNK